MSMIKVAGTSRTSAVAGAIAGVFRDNKRAEAQAIGAIAVNQVIKAIILARSYLSEDGYDIQVIPEFADVEIDGKTRTAIKFIVEERGTSNGVASAPSAVTPTAVTPISANGDSRMEV
jgi:stage V sporulation protein S